jgi:hypothetical protein
MQGIYEERRMKDGRVVTVLELLKSGEYFMHVIYNMHGLPGGSKDVYAISPRADSKSFIEIGIRNARTLQAEHGIALEGVRAIPFKVIKSKWYPVSYREKVIFDDPSNTNTRCIHGPYKELGHVAPVIGRDLMSESTYLDFRLVPAYSN